MAHINLFTDLGVKKYEKIHWSKNYGTSHTSFCGGYYDKDRKPNVMTAAWGGICCSIPPCVAVFLREATYSYQNILIIMHLQSVFHLKNM